MTKSSCPFPLSSGAVVGFGSAALAQTTPATTGVVEEVVVTARRQCSTVNKVALFITAATEKSLKQQGIHNGAVGGSIVTAICAMAKSVFPVDPVVYLKPRVIGVSADYRL